MAPAGARLLLGQLFLSAESFPSPWKQTVFYPITNKANLGTHFPLQIPPRVFALEQSSSKESAVLFGPFLFSSPWARARIPRPQLCCSCSCRGPRGLRVAQATIISVSAPSNSVGLCLPCSSLTPQSADLPTCLLSLAPFLVLLTPLTPLPLSVTSSRLWL